MIVSELFDDVGDKHQKKIAIDTVKNPSKSLLGGPSPEEAEKILKDKFGMSDKQIQKLKEGLRGLSFWKSYLKQSKEPILQKDIDKLVVLAFSIQ